VRARSSAPAVSAPAASLVDVEVNEAKVTSKGGTKDNALDRGDATTGAEITLLFTERGQALGHTARGGSDASIVHAIAIHMAMTDAATVRSSDKAPAPPR
jgi:hypothetical protein